MQLEFLAMSGADSKQLVVAVIGIIALLFLYMFFNEKTPAEITILVGIPLVLGVILFVGTSPSIDQPFGLLIKGVQQNRTQHQEPDTDKRPKAIVKSNYQDNLKKHFPELKRANVELVGNSSTISIYCNKKRIATSINTNDPNGKLMQIIPINDSGLAFTNVVNYLRKHDVVKNSTDLKIVVKPSETYASYYAKNGKMLVEANSDNPRKVSAKTVNFE